MAGDEHYWPGDEEGKLSVVASKNSVKVRCAPQFAASTRLVCVPRTRFWSVVGQRRLTPRLVNAGPHGVRALLLGGNLAFFPHERDAVRGHCLVSGANCRVRVRAAH